MKLYYHKGKNFGDALNPIIFNHFLKGDLDNDDSVIIIGIGSIIGLFNKPKNCKKVYVFSSGFAGGNESTYGQIPTLDESYEIIGVRGPKTANALKISEDFIIGDGALLLPIIKPLPTVEKIYNFSYMPHVGSLDMFNQWSEILNSLGIHLIDPRLSPDDVLLELGQTKVLLTEAMHGAIIADAYQIPWIPIKSNHSINEYKWKDYLSTVNIDYKPNIISTIYSYSFLKKLFISKLGVLKLFASPVSFIYWNYQKIVIIPKVKKSFIGYTKLKTFQANIVDIQSLQKRLINKFKLLKAKIHA